MSTARRGISDHQLVEAFEAAHQRFRARGIDDRQASRMALYASFRLSEAFTDAQAWQAVAEVLGPQATQPTVELGSTESKLT